MKPTEIYAVFQSFKALVADPAFKDVDITEVAEEFKRSLPPQSYTPHAKATIAAVIAAFDVEIVNGRKTRPGVATEREAPSAEIRTQARTGTKAQEFDKKPRGKQGSKLSS